MMKLTLFFSIFFFYISSLAGVESRTFDLQQVKPLTASAAKDSVQFEFLYSSNHNNEQAEIDLSSSKLSVEEQINNVVARKSWRPDIRKIFIQKQVELCLKKEVSPCPVAYGIAAFPATLANVQGDNLLATEESNLIEALKAPVFKYFEPEIEKQRDFSLKAKMFLFFQEYQEQIPFGFLHIESQNLMTQSTFINLGFAREISNSSASGVISNGSGIQYLSTALFESDEAVVYKNQDDCHLYDQEMTPVNKGRTFICLKEGTLYIDGGLINRKIMNMIMEKSSKFDRLELNVAGGLTSQVDFKNEKSSESKVSAVEFIKTLRKNNITTSVRKGALCGSLCTLLFQAGVQRVAHSESKFFYHGVVYQKLQWERCIKDSSQESCLEEVNNEIMGWYSLLWMYGANPNFVMKILRSQHDSFEIEGDFVNPSGVSEFWFDTPQGIGELKDAGVVTQIL